MFFISNSLIDSLRQIITFEISYEVTAVPTDT
jgi:hypothetical protein